jgi:chromate transporter
MVLALSALYVRFGGLGWMRAAFYGVGAAVIAIIGRSAAKLAGLTLGKDRLLWAVGGVNAFVTAWMESELLPLFFVSGAALVLVRAPPKLGRAAPLWLPPALLTGLHGPATPDTLRQLAWYFTEAGAVVFGSGLAIVPFLRGGVVERFHWLTDRQFLDAIAVAMITPGPVVITVAFIGYLVAGPLGATAAAIGVFLPCYLLVILPAPYYRRFARNPQLKAFVAGVTAAATGAIAGAAFVLGRRAIVDAPTALIALATLAALLKLRRLPEPMLILAAGSIGMLLTGTQGGRLPMESPWPR